MDHIVGAIKRVISEPDNVDRDNIIDNTSAIFLAGPPATLDGADESSRPPVVVEMEDPMDADAVDAADESGTSTSSSLSDGNEQHARMTSGMHRSDSRTSENSDVSSVRTSQNGSGNWGWFEDVHESSRIQKKAKNRTDSDVLPETHSEAAAMAVTAPTYVLEESLSSQKLWKDTAGNRPPQPVEERAFYEKMWAQNFAKSQVAYGMPVEVLTATSPISLSPFADGNFRTELSNYDIKEDSKQPADLAEAALVDRLQGHHKEFGVKAMEPQHPQLTVVNKRVKGSESDPSLTVLVRGDNVFGTTVSKSFARASETGGPVEGVDTVNISIASYRVVESKKHGKYAQYLVIYREGSIRDTVGVWKRYSDFADLSRKVTHQHESCASVLQNMSPLAVTEEPETEHLPNAITSWRLLKKRQRWYRCLDAGYLSLKVFLLERFLHDILFESSSPRLLRGFVGSEEVSSDSSAASK